MRTLPLEHTYISPARRPCPLKISLDGNVAHQVGGNEKQSANWAGAQAAACEDMLVVCSCGSTLDMAPKKMQPSPKERHAANVQTVRQQTAG